MPWAKFGDNSATYPRLMQIAGFPGADARAVNEVRGFINACATQSAGHTTDYLVDFGTAQMFGGARTKKLIGWCVRAGLLTEVEVEGIRQWAIINDPEFIHIRTRDELQWERQQRADTRDPGLAVPVRLRDGDNCRWCGVLVEWRGKKSHKSAELDHLEPGKPATVDTFVVTCRRCNGSRQDNPQWDDDHTIRPVPARPNYGRWTAEFLTENGYPTQPNIRPDTISASPKDPAAPARPTDPAPSWARPADPAAGARPDVPPPMEPAAEVPPEVPANSVTCSDRTSSAGSGRDGTVRAGQGQDGQGRDGPGRAGQEREGREPSAPGAPAPNQPRKRRRAKRGRTTTPTQQPGGETR